MTRVQKAQMKQSELRSRIAEELDKSEGDRTEGLLDSLTTDMKGIETELRAALSIEEESAVPDQVTTPEQVELVELRSRVDFSRYLSAAIAGNGVMSGPELEYNQEIGLPENRFPLEILAPPVEVRTARDGQAQSNQGEWLDRLFSDTASTYLGVSMRSVQPGVASYPVTTQGGEPVQRGRSEAVAESVYNFNIVEMKPTRASVYGKWTLEDSARLPGMADAIARDMQAAMIEKIDRIMFLGDSGASENNADIVGMNTAAITEVSLTQANKVKPAETLAAFLGMIDGVYAATVSDLNVVATVGSLRLWEGTIANSAAENETVAGFLRAAGLSWTSRGEIETNTANDDFGAFVGRGRGIDGSAISAIWNSGELIRDQYTRATQGEVRLILHFLHDFKIPRPANYQRLKFVT